MAITEKEINQFTRLLRTGDDPLWKRMRELLSARGLDVQDVLLADSFEDDVDFEFGILVTRTGSVIQYGMDYKGKGVSEGVITEWKDLTGNYLSTPYHPEASLALKMWKRPV